MKFKTSFLINNYINDDLVRIRFRVRWRGNVVSYNIKYKVNPFKWNKETQRCIANSSHGDEKIPANRINRLLQLYEDECRFVFIQFQTSNVVPTKDQFRSEFNKRIGKDPTNENNSKEKLNFFTVFDIFIKEQELIFSWTENTKGRMNALKQKLYEFDDKISFEDINETKLAIFRDYLSYKLNYRNTTTNKAFSNLNRFLKWSVKNEYTKNDKWKYFKPNLPTAQKKIIFLTQDEIALLKEFDFSSGDKYLETVRDVFLFMCYTGLRYSDVRKLKISNIKDNFIEIVTKKAIDSLVIELNNTSREILNKYVNKQDEMALPVISNQKMNDYLKELGELVGIDDTVQETYFIGKKRYDINQPKYSLLSTHAGRRTFISTALSLGISHYVVMKWTGHADYKAMKPYIDVADNIKQNEMGKFNK